MAQNQCADSHKRCYMEAESKTINQFATRVRQMILQYQSVTKQNEDLCRQVAEQQQTAVDTGKSDDLAGAMIASQQASLSFSALVQVRNKIATGFNDLMSMSI